MTPSFSARKLRAVRRVCVWCVLCGVWYVVCVCVVCDMLVVLCVLFLLCEAVLDTPVCAILPDGAFDEAVSWQICAESVRSSRH